MKGQRQQEERKASDEVAYDSCYQIDDQPGNFSFHNLLGQKTGGNAYYQEPDQGFNRRIDSQLFLPRQSCDDPIPSPSHPRRINLNDFFLSP
jgi:hypothetical protein